MPRVSATRSCCVVGFLRDLTYVSGAASLRPGSQLAFDMAI